MKKLVFTLALNALFCIYGNAQGSAEWNGSVSSDWNTPANWTWTNGSGIPGPNDDVILANSINQAHIPIHATANCRNIKLGKVNGDFVTLHLEDSTTLNVYGNILEAYDGTITSSSFEDKSSTLNLLGIGNQTVDIAEIRIGNINVNKASGDILLSTNQNKIYIANSLNFLSQPVAVGSDPAGNIVMNATAIIFYANNAQARITTTPYLDNQTPPHLVTNSNYSDIYFFYDFTGDKFIPLAPYVTGFNPITIHSVAESWYVQCWGPPENACDSFYSIDGAVRRTWIVKPTTELGTKTNSSYPASISMTFHVNNVGRDVPANFNPYNSPLDIWRLNRSTQCWNKVGQKPMPTTGYVTITTPTMSMFNKLALAPDTTKPLPQAINSIANAMNNILIYPNPAINKLTLDFKNYSKTMLQISIFDVLGKEIFSKELKNANLLSTYDIDMHNFLPGLYTVRLSNNEFTDTQKVLKH